jgi:hypothetical protein
MGSPFFYEKQPSEKYNIDVDFAEDRLESGESISSTSVTAEKCSDETDATSDIIDNDSESGGVVTVRTKNGTDGERYRITIVVTTDATNIYESDVILAVIDR